nr:trichohyalin-like [Penaeus vannamei]
MDGLENTEVPARDLRILEMLARKHEKLFAEEQRSHLAHRAWHQQKERERKEAAAQWAEWRAHVNEKRRQENDENERRWRRNQEVYRQSQEKLARLIYGKERRALEVLGEQQDARMRRLGERRAAEASRKAAQEEALRAKEEAEERKRQHLIQLWSGAAELVEQRRREREEFFRKRVEDGNSAEAERNEARRVQVEARAEALLEAMRHNMEERLSRAEHNLRMLNEVKEDTLRRQRDERGGAAWPCAPSTTSWRRRCCSGASTSCGA